MTDNKQDFGTDVARLLDIVANALYTNRDVFLRELISNASDACDRLRYEALQNSDLAEYAKDFRIDITIDTDTRTLRVADNGIGMDKQDLVDNLGTIAKSGTAAIMDQAKDDKDKLNLIGQFGVGFYACFMISNKVEVVSKKAGDEQSWHWESDGRTGFTIREATEEESFKNPGTSIIIHINDDASDYLVEDKLREIILSYSDHIGVPIHINDQDAPVNSASALWTRPKTEITDAQYKEFYQNIGHVFDEPIMTSHWRAEGVIEYTALLFLPSMRPWDLYEPGRKHAVRLYVKRVYITDQIENLIYPWLRFVRGVIDSEDLPLNISREMLQNNPVVSKIRKGVTKRILDDLYKLSDNDEAAFETFWHQFGAALKEGLYDAVEHREGIFKVCRFHSTHDDTKLTCLADYINRMKDDQESIYYISGENADTLRNSPQLEGFQERGIEVLFMTDTIDEFWLQVIGDYQGKKFQSVTKSNVDLSAFDTDKKDEQESETEEKKEVFKVLREVLYAELKDHVGNVKLSTRLTQSPVCLVAQDGDVDIHMERVLKIQQNYESQSKKVLEINPDHALIKNLGKLAEANKDSDDLKDAAWLLLDQAKIIQGEPVSDPSAFTRRMSDFMKRGLAA